MTLINFQRDMHWTDGASKLDWSAQTGYGNGSISVSTDGNVYHNVAWAIADTSSDVSVNPQNVRAVGLHMLPPYGDRVPYRVKAQADSESGAKFILMIGRGPTTPSAGDNTIVGGIPIAMPNGVVDETFCLQDYDETDPSYGDPVTFALCMLATSNDRAFASLSVQRLIVQPPSYAVAVS